MGLNPGAVFSVASDTVVLCQLGSLSREPHFVLFPYITGAYAQSLQIPSLMSECLTSSWHFDSSL